jgi:CubicO group peptidase (beta-lactamase class C family)
LPEPPRAVDALQDLVDRWARERQATYQVSVSVGGATVFAHTSGVDGLLERVDDHTLYHTYCLPKPAVALAAISVLARHGIGPTDPLREVLKIDAFPDGPIDRIPRIFDHPAVTAANVLSHDIGFVDPGGLTYRLRPIEQRGNYLAELPEPQLVPAYSEVVAGVLLEWVSASLGHELAAEVERIAGPDVIVDGESARGRTVAVAVGGRIDNRVPLLGEVVNDGLDDVRPAFGGLATASGVAHLGRTFALTIRGEGEPGNGVDGAAARFAANLRRPAFDRALNRVCGFCCFAMTDIESLAETDEGRAVPLWGHTVGYFPSILAFLPDGEVSMAVLSSEMLLGPDLLAARSALLSRLAAVAAELSRR